MLPYVPPRREYLLPALKIVTPGAGDAGVARDREAAPLDDVGAAAMVSWRCPRR